jgi:dipeptidyl aminopeptidase/acylaminoacyl peptidase
VQDFRFAPRGSAVALVRTVADADVSTIEVYPAAAATQRWSWPLRAPSGPRLVDVSLETWAGNTLYCSAAVEGSQDRALHALDVETGLLRLVARTSAYPSVSDHDGVQQAVVTLSHGGRLQQCVGTVRLPIDGAVAACAVAAWQPRVLVAAAAGSGPAESVSAVGFQPDQIGVLAIGNLGREYRALLVLVRDGDVRCLRERAGAELESACLSRDRHRVLLVWNVEGRSQIEVVDPVSGEVVAHCDPPGDVVYGADIAPDGERIAVAVTDPAQPSQVWEMDPDGARARRLSPAHRGPARRTPDAELIRVRSRDGTPLTAWAYRPAGSLGGACVLSLHGGPDAQERPAHDPLRAALLARNITVVAPNVRGSRGFGRTFSAKDDREGRFGAREDVVAIAGAVLERGLASPGQLGVLGTSYGGYLALCALQDAVEVFAAGVLVSGVTDLARYVEGTAGWRRPIAAAEFGDPEHDAALLERLSPLPGLLRSRAPLLVVHGSRDRVVPTADAIDVVRRLRRAEREVDLFLVPGAGHGFAPRHLRAVTRRVGHWLSLHLAGHLAGAA